MDYKNIIVEIKDDVAVVTLNRKKALNALNYELIAELHDFFSKNWIEHDFRCVVLTGAGKAFVAGADIAELSELNAATAANTSGIGHYLMKTIENFPTPVIAAVNGFALGGGCELAMACDIRIASEKAKIGQPEINLGIIPGYGGTQRLPRLVGIGMAKKLIYTGDMINAAEAYRIGLVDELCAPDELMDRAMAIARNIASKSGPVMKLAKDAINRGMSVNLSAGCSLERGAFGVTYGYSDSTEGLKAFTEKRPPKFEHK
ncbi:MAG: enoyl-CoA hydratase-related protein [Candidatus Zixiibacteriota bacterium]